MTVEIEVQDQHGTRSTETFDYLVVASDPLDLRQGDVLDERAKERQLFDGLTRFTFCTRVGRASAEGRPEHGVVFSPHRLSSMNGRVQAFRNETAKQLGLEEANRILRSNNNTGTNVVTTYQLSSGDMSQSEFDDKFREEMNEGIPWWPFKTWVPALDDDHEPIQFRTPYFTHFSEDALVAQAPWEMLNIQGQNSTLYVHAFTCFESVLHCYEYIEMLFDRGGLNLPAKNGRIVIVGGGVSGLLAAWKLKREGFTDVTVLEKRDRIGGKTLTAPVDGIKCELGTCYMSPGYDHLVEKLEPYLEGNERFSFDLEDSPIPGFGHEFRGVATEGQFPLTPSIDPVLGFKGYVLAKAAEVWTEKQLPAGPMAWVAGALDLVLGDFGGYGRRHQERMTLARPMPAEAPAFLEDRETFGQWIDRIGVATLEGALQYAYSVQGYGVLDQIPAYYGHVWVTPEAMDIQRAGLRNLVTAWKEGWGDIWRQLHLKEGLNVRMNTTVASIVRS